MTNLLAYQLLGKNKAMGRRYSSQDKQKERTPGPHSSLLLPSRWKTVQGPPIPWRRDFSSRE